MTNTFEEIKRKNFFNQERLEEMVDVDENVRDISSDLKGLASKISAIADRMDAKREELSNAVDKQQRVRAWNRIDELSSIAKTSRSGLIKELVNLYNGVFKEEKDEFNVDEFLGLPWVDKE